MDITWLGGNAFRITSGGRTIVTDPDDAGNLAASGAQIVTVSHGPPPEAGDAFVIVGPGEYEVRDVFMVGVATVGLPEHDGVNTAYCLTMDDVTVCHLGAIGAPLTQAHRDEIGSVDVLIVPVTGPPGITPEAAVELVNVLEPALVIPVHGVGQGRLAQFLREMAAEETEPVTVLSVNSLRLPDQPEVRVLVPKTVD